MSFLWFEIANQAKKFKSIGSTSRANTDETETVVAEDGGQTIQVGDQLLFPIILVTLGGGRQRQNM
jgi:hypothetical protein